MAWPLDLFNPTPSPEEVKGQLGRILASPEFARATRLRELLEFVVNQTLEGRADRLAGHAIAEAVFHRGKSFDPETDSIVRTEAARLRSRLQEYYGNSGRRDRVHILLNRGEYLPVFLIREPRLWWRLLDFLRAQPVRIAIAVGLALAALGILAVSILI